MWIVSLSMIGILVIWLFVHYLCREPVRARALDLEQDEEGQLRVAAAGPGAARGAGAEWPVEIELISPGARGVPAGVQRMGGLPPFGYPSAGVGAGAGMIGAAAGTGAGAGASHGPAGGLPDPVVPARSPPPLPPRPSMPQQQPQEGVAAPPGGPPAEAPAPAQPIVLYDPAPAAGRYASSV